MRLNRWNRSATLASIALLPLHLASAQGVERNLFTWSSTVDKEVVIQVHGRDVATRGSGLDASISPRLNMSQPLPRVAGFIHARLESGRGDVDVLENPSPRNDYTATLRIRDTRGGADRYRLVVTFDDYNGGAVIGDRNGRDERNQGDRGDRANRGDQSDRGGYDPDRGDRGGYDANGNRSVYDGNGNRSVYDRNDHGNDRGWYDRSRRDAGAVRWRGLVDGVAEIRIQGNRVDAYSRQGQRLRDVRYDMLGADLPRRDVQVLLADSDGRGRVVITQQPSRNNGYVAVVRVEDRRGGYGAYDFDVRW